MDNEPRLYWRFCRYKVATESPIQSDDTQGNLCRWVMGCCWSCISGDPVDREEPKESTEIYNYYDSIVYSLIIVKATPMQRQRRWMPVCCRS